MRAVAQSALGEEPWSAAGWVAAYERHVAVVRASIPEDRLLVYSVREGWGPLCRFLGVPIPRTPFPRTNDRRSFLRAAASFGRP